MVTVKDVEKGSPAYLAGVLPGDIIISVNGNEINDVLDYRYYTTEKKLSLSIMRDRSNKDISLKKKDQYDELGLEFETYLMDKQHSCRNKCIFCFIDQNPHGMRDTIYFKDDDSRMSFFFGSYVTLTNLSQSDVDRIIKMRISPVNISVHTTDPDLRVEMMKNKNAGKVLSYLRDFDEGGIMMNCQIVLCKNVNDGDYLRKSLSDLSSYSHIQSIAVVPAGLTAHRCGLYELEPFSSQECLDVIKIIDECAKKNLSEKGARLCYASDEWYIKAGLDIPDSDYYEEYPQIENGVGMIRSMGDEVDDEIDYLVSDGFELENKRNISVATGEAAYDFIKNCVEKLTDKWYNLNCNVYKIKNEFFGGEVTVAGLLTGGDLKAQLSGKPLGDILYIPSVMLRHEGDKFLDDMTVSELSKALSVEIRPISSDGAEFVDNLLGC